MPRTRQSPRWRVEEGGLREGEWTDRWPLAEAQGQVPEGIWRRAAEVARGNAWQDVAAGGGRMTAYRDSTTAAAASTAARAARAAARGCPAQHPLAARAARAAAAPIRPPPD